MLDIYAGAGQSDITKGYLTIDHDGSSATVTYEGKPGWFFNETHRYVGSQMYPTVKQGNKMVFTVSPGQFRTSTRSTRRRPTPTRSRRLRRPT